MAGEGMTRLRFLALLALACLCGAARPVLAAESEAARSPRAVVTLVSDTDAWAPGRPLHLGLRLRLAPGWHTYWLNPGDAGAPPEIKLTLPPGAAVGGIEWPTPERLPEGPLMAYGYTGEVVLPLRVTPAAGAASGAALSVEAEANWLVCATICVPEQARFRLVLRPGEAAPSAEAPLFAAAAARRPVPSPFQAGRAADGTLWLAGAGLSADSVRAAWFFPEAWGTVDQDAPQSLAAHPGWIGLALPRPAGADPKARLRGVLVLRDQGGGETALALDAPPAPLPASPPADRVATATVPGAAPGTAPGAVLAAASLPAAVPAPVRGETGVSWRVLGLAWLGGLVLNLMPCVFPVLAVKALGLARLSGASRRAVRGRSAAYALGVLVCFAALGGLMLGLRAAGAGVGWGFQFQSPVFVAGLSWLLFGMGLNLSGVFSLGAGAAGLGQDLAARGGHAGSFFTGLLAVVVATPCTAPFMGAAVAAALAGPAWFGMAVFLALGAGLAAPTLLFALWPGLMRFMPRPGAWMEALKQALAFPLYAAAVWLVWVAGQQAGPNAVLAVLAGAVLIGFALWAIGLAQQREGRGRRMFQGVAFTAGAVAMAVLSSLAGIAPAATGVAAAAQGEVQGEEAFSAARLAALRAEGRPVFIDLSASWCVTCLVNERVALAPRPVQAAFAAHRVAYLKGDWTRGDPEIAAFLRAQGRDGVPLYLLYPPRGGAPELLPQILTEAGMLERLNRLGG